MTNKLLLSVALLALLATLLSGCLTQGGQDDVSGIVDPACNANPLRCDPPKLPNGTWLHGLTPNLTVPATLNLTVPTFQVFNVGQEAVEPTIGVTPKGTVFMVAETHVMRSKDGGKTWEDVTIQAGGVTIPPITLDPMLYVDPVTGRVFFDTLYVGCSFLSYSDDEGETWIHNPAACGLPVNDHQTLATGKAMLPQAVYPRALYYCFNQLVGAQCAVSLDGGLTFPIVRDVFPPERFACGGITGHVTTAPDGTVYLPSWQCDEPWLGISRDGGLTWESKRVAPKLDSGGMDPSVAVDAKGNAYYFWMTKKGVPHLTISKDAGRTWSDPINVAFPDLKTSTLPTITAGDEGRIAFAYLGVTEGPAKAPEDVSGDTSWHWFVTQSINALDAEPVLVTRMLNDPAKPVHQGPCDGGYRCGNILDFIDVTTGPDGRVFAVNADLAGMGIVGVLETGTSLLAAKGELKPLHE